MRRRYIAPVPPPAPSTAIDTTADRPAEAVFDEAAARRVLLVRAFESRGDGPQWTAEDRAWATRLAGETAPPERAGPARWLDERAGHALQRLAPRDAGVARELARRGWRTAWLVGAVALGLGVGVACDAVGARQRIDLLAPPVAAVLAWNALVYLMLVLPLPPLRRARGAVARWLGARLGGDPRAAAGAERSAAAVPPLADFHATWARAATPLLAARAAVLLHAAAAALAAGLIAGLYARGLVLDYRAAWQSTFVDAAQVRAVLATLLAPASALTGIAVPDTAALEALRVGPGAAGSAMATPAHATAAPWIHLYAVTLALAVVLPRTLLAAHAAWLGWRRARRLQLPMADPYFQRLLRGRRTQAAVVQVLPHGAAPTPHALTCLQQVLGPLFGGGFKLLAAGATAYGAEESASAAPPAGTTLRLVLVDLAATPEDDTHGAFVSALRAAAPAVPLLVLADESAYAARFATLPGRVEERRAAWRRWAQAAGVDIACVDLARPDLARAAAELQVAA